MKVQSMFLDGEILGSYLATVLSLNRQYFANAYKRNFKVNVQMRELHGFVFVKVPDEVRSLIDQGFVARKLDDEDTADYAYKFELSKDCVVGFWK